jgi:hypothetical protein
VALNCAGLTCGVGIFLTAGSAGHELKNNRSGGTTVRERNSACAYAIDKFAGPGQANIDRGGNRANGRVVNPLGNVRGVRIECIN